MNRYTGSVTSHDNGALVLWKDYCTLERTMKRYKEALERIACGFEDGEGHSGSYCIEIAQNVLGEEE